MSEFSDRAVLVTGASGGLGTAVTDAFLSEGATVAGVSRSGESRPGADQFLGVAADLGSPEGAKKAVQETLDKAGRLDCLVHLVGGYAGGKTFAETDDATWDKMMNLNVRSAINMMRAALPHLREQSYGRIVAVGARVGVKPEAELSAYAASKAALHALIQAIAEETRDAGITANVVLPSVIDTPANRDAMPDADFSKWVKPESIARQIVWLCSDAAADISGALIPIYGRS